MSIECFFYAKAGLRYEHTNDDGITLEGLSVSNKYDHWFPFAEISYNPSDNHSFALSYSKRIDRPSMNDMNPTRVFRNTYTYTEGNDRLTPSVMDNLELNYVFKGNFSFNLYYYHTSDAIQNLTQVVDDLFTKYSPKNCLTINTFGTDASYNFSFGKFNLYSSVSMFYVKAKSYVDELDDKRFAKSEYIFFCQFKLPLQSFELLCELLSCASRNRRILSHWKHRLCRLRMQD